MDIRSLFPSIFHCDPVFSLRKELEWDVGGWKGKLFGLNKDQKDKVQEIINGLGYNSEFKLRQVTQEDSFSDPQKERIIKCFQACFPPSQAISAPPPQHQSFFTLLTNSSRAHLKYKERNSIPSLRLLKDLLRRINSYLSVMPKT